MLFFIHTRLTEKGVILIDRKAVPGEWFLGEAPEKRQAPYPPIVFVQGRNSSASSWFGETIYYGLNDMEKVGRDAGYQTVFLELFDSDETGSRSQWENGKLLSGLLKEISTHFGQKVNIIAHSKGGIDVQTALVHYDAHPYVGRVFTLSAPHSGSHLADLSFSWYAAWLADLLGQNDDGTFSLQTGEMRQFRTMTDAHQNIDKNTYYTAAGSSHGPLLSSLSVGGAYLSSYGENDGLVNVWSTVLPYGKHLFTDKKLDHDSVRIGSRFFSKVEPFLTSTEISPVHVKGMQPEEPPEMEGNHIIRGGPLPAGQSVNHSFAIEETAEVDFFVLSARRDTTLSLRSPSGIVILPEQPISVPSKSYFGGAWLHLFKMNQAEAGSWELTLQSPANDAFLFIGNIVLPSPIQITFPDFSQKDTMKRTLMQSQANKGAIHKCHWKIIDRDGALIHESTTRALGTSHDCLPSITKEGTYNITVEIEGENENGKPFNRTIVRSVYLLV
ncbi:esterase/lipase family protein [Pradoshia sp.]